MQICSVAGCEREARLHGLCRAHNIKRLKYGDPAAGITRAMNIRYCSVDGCGREHRGRGYCEPHLYRLKKHGDPLGGRQRGDPTPPRMGPKGYQVRWMPDHPNANSTGRVQEHHFVMSQVLGRPIRPDEMVHHKNGVRHDNRPENLELCVLKRQPPGQRIDDLVDWAVALLRDYRPDLLADDCGQDHKARTAPA